MTEHGFRYRFQGVSGVDAIEEMLVGMLLEAGDGPVSARALSNKLGLEPREILLRLDGLRTRGYRIDLARGGYRLVSMPDSLAPLEVEAFLTTRELGRLIHYRRSVPSTNVIASALAREGAFHGEIVVSEEQTQGRGRRGRSWFSPDHRNLYVSIVLRPDIEAARAPEITFVTAVAVAEAIGAYARSSPGVKWPNDVLLEGKKVAGILTEVSTDGDRAAFVVAGIGVNANMRSAELPDDLRDTATSLLIDGKEKVCRPRLLATLLESTERWYSAWLEEGFQVVREQWLSRNVTIGKDVCLEDTGGLRLIGRAIDLDEHGALLLRLDDGRIERVISGDVQVLAPARPRATRRHMPQDG